MLAAPLVTTPEPATIALAALTAGGSSGIAGPTTVLQTTRRSTLARKKATTIRLPWWPESSEGELRGPTARPVRCSTDAAPVKPR